MPALRLVRSLAAIVRSPVPAERRRDYADAWERLPEPLRTPSQMLGRKGGVRGATLGGAGGLGAQSVDEIKRQMRLLRPVLGARGSLRLTDGEITLRRLDEGIELLRYAHSLGLVPMLMTRGEVFRRRSGLLERLMWEGGLSEIGIQVDTTQRARDPAPRDAGPHDTGPQDAAPPGTGRPPDEAALDPLRDEFADMVREARRRTGLPLGAALSMAVRRENLAGVPGVLHWLLRNGDAFQAISFHPAAHAARADDRPVRSAVTADELWARIAEGAWGPDGSPDAPRRGQEWHGHHGCSRLLHGVVARRRGGPPVFHPVREDGDPLDARVVDGFLQRFGGVTFSGDSRGEAAARLLGLAAHAPDFVARNGPPYALHWLRRLDPGHPMRAARELATGRLRLSRLTLESHHFASSAELEMEAAVGRERVIQCAFHVPAGDRVVSMCEVNALLGGRVLDYPPASAAGGPRPETTGA